VFSSLKLLAISRSSSFRNGEWQRAILRLSESTWSRERLGYSSLGGLIHEYNRAAA